MPHGSIILFSCLIKGEHNEQSNRYRFGYHKFMRRHY